MASNIALHEAGIQFEISKVDRRTKRADGVEFVTINPKGYVPALRLDDGQVLTENVAVLQYIADLNPAAKLAPPAGTMERYRLQEWLSFINSEVHKAFTPLFSPEATEDTKAYARNYIAKRLTYVEGALGDRQYLMGEQFTAADVVIGSGLRFGMMFKGLPERPEYVAYTGRVTERPAAKRASQKDHELMAAAG